MGGKPRPEGVESGSKLTEWYTHCVGVSLLAYGAGGGGPAPDIWWTAQKLEVPLDSGHYE